MIALKIRTLYLSSSLFEVLSCILVLLFQFNLRENKEVKVLFGCSENGGKENRVMLFWDPFFFFAYIIRKMKN